MPRIRTIKPSFFASEDVAELSYRERLTWVGLWTHVDDNGRAKDNVRLIKAAVWPLDDVSLEDVEADLTVLALRGRIVRYEVAGKRFLAVTNWLTHQKINRPTESALPGPDDAMRAHVTLTESAVSVHVRKGREGKGRGAPAARCQQHIGAADSPPCGKCGDARRAHDDWLRDQRDKPTTTGLPPAADSTRCAVDGHETELATHCRICASERKSA